MQFKYQTFHTKLKCSCPSDKVRPLNMTAYRFIFEDVNHYNNHHPVLKITPSRFDPADEDCDHQCNGFALSLYENPRKAEKKLQRFLDDKPYLAEQFGTCIGEVQLTPNDGEGDTPEKRYSHFNYHEYDNTVLQFVVIKKLA